MYLFDYSLVDVDVEDLNVVLSSSWLENVDEEDDNNIEECDEADNNNSIEDEDKNSCGFMDGGRIVWWTR